MSHYIEIDQTTWKRTQHCECFRQMLIPCFNVCYELDITKFYHFVKAKKLSFTLSMMHVVAKCANEIENFRYRFLDGKVALYDQCSVSFVWLNQETELFKYVTFPLLDNLEEFVREAKKAAEAQVDYFPAPPANDSISFSPLPWISYTEKSHTQSGNKEQACPIIDLGKFFERDGKIIMPISVQAHHSFVDGFHMGKLANALQETLNQDWSKRIG